MQIGLRFLVLSVVVLLAGCSGFGQTKRPNDQWLHESHPLPEYMYDDGVYSSTPVDEQSISKPVYYHSNTHEQGGGAAYQSQADEIPTTETVSKRHKDERDEMHQQINQTLGK